MDHAGRASRNVRRDVDPLGVPYPGFVRDQAGRDRWDIVTLVSEVWWRMHEPDRPPDGRWRVWTPRWLFESDIPTGTPDDPDAFERLCVTYAGRPMR